MKAIPTLLAGLILSSPAFAQETPEANPPGISEEVLKAIEEFNRRKKASAPEEKEIVVVLDPPAVEKAKDKGDKPVLVTGKPPVVAQEESPGDFNEVDPFADAESKETEPKPLISDKIAPPPAIPEQPALEARVESIKSSGTPIDPSQVTLKASFPAKPLSEAPQGWIVEKSDNSPLFEKNVELSPGTTITLSIRPHILAPAADGAKTFSVQEPGFDPAQGYKQDQTVAAILGTSVSQLDRDSLQLGNAISELHRLLASLPQPEEPEKP